MSAAGARGSRHPLGEQEKQQAPRRTDIERETPVGLRSHLDQEVGLAVPDVLRYRTVELAPGLVCRQVEGASRQREKVGRLALSRPMGVQEGACRAVIGPDVYLASHIF